MSKKCHFLRFLWVSTTVRTSSECYVCVSPCKSLKWSFQKRAKGGPQQSEPASTLLCLAHHNRDDLQQQSLALWMVIKIWAAKKKPMLLSSSTDSWKWPCLWTTISLSKSETRIQSSKEMDKSPTFTSFLKLYLMNSLKLRRIPMRHYVVSMCIWLKGEILRAARYYLVLSDDVCIFPLIIIR